MTRFRRREIVLIEVAALILAMTSASGVLQVPEEGLKTGLMIMGVAISISVLRHCWRQMLPSIIAATILFTLASTASVAGAPKIVPAALIALAIGGIAWASPETRRAWAERRWLRQPPADSPQM